MNRISTSLIMENTNKYCSTVTGPAVNFSSKFYHSYIIYTCRVLGSVAQRETTLVWAGIQCSASASHWARIQCSASATIRPTRRRGATYWRDLELRDLPGRLGVSGRGVFTGRCMQKQRPHGVILGKYSNQNGKTGGISFLPEISALHNFRN